TRSKRDWSSDVCSSDLEAVPGRAGIPVEDDRCAAGRFDPVRHRGSQPGVAAGDEHAARGKGGVWHEGSFQPTRSMALARRVVERPGWYGIDTTRPPHSDRAAASGRVSAL